MIPMYNTKRFCEIWDEVSKFSTDYKETVFYDVEFDPITHAAVNLHNSLTDDNINKLFYLLYASYGNNPIANLDENQFKYKVFGIIFEYGPAWQKELEIQDRFRNLSDDEIRTSQFAIYNQAAHDATAPTTNTTQELQYINNQSTSRLQKGLLNGYNDLLILMKKDVTKAFIDRFKNLFKKVLYEPRPTLYVTDIEEDEDE